MMRNMADLTVGIEGSVRKILAGHPLLEDAVQEAHIDAWRRHQEDPSTPLGHLLVSARRRAQDVAVGKQALGAPHRSPGSGSRRVTHGSLEGRPDILVDHQADVEGRDLVDRALSVLDEDEQGIARLMMVGHRHSEVAEEFGRSVGWVRARMPRMREKLTPFLDDLRCAA